MLMVMLVLLVLTFTLGSLTHYQYQNVIKEEYSLHTLNAAETGIEAAIAKVGGEPFWYQNLPLAGPVANAVVVFAETELANQVSYEVQAKKYAQDIGTSWHIVSVGRHRTGEGAPVGQKTLLSTVGVYEAGDYFRGLTVLPGELVSLDLDHPLVLDGDLLISGATRIAGTTVISGVVYAGGNITGTWSGTKRAGYAFIPPYPEPREDVYLINAAAYGEVYLVDTSFGSYAEGEPGAEEPGPVTQYDGIYYVDGDITIGGSYRGAALFFATGGITVAGHLTPEPGADGQPDAAAGMLALVALEDVDIGDYTVYANILAGGCLRASAGAALYGSACVTGLDFGGSGSEPVYIYHHENLYPIEDFIPTKTKIVDWQEQYTVF